MSPQRLTCRLLPYIRAEGPHQMAADEVLLETAATGVASLRFYGWSPATLSLGYFQAERLRQTDVHLAALPYVRRPSGGATLVHEHEVTYALGLPAGPPWQTGEPWLRRMHALIAEALRSLGVVARLHEVPAEEPNPFVLCFQHFTPGDLLLGSAKIVGSAQRRQRRALLQHGAILLAASPSTPILPGIRELTGQALTAAEICPSVQQAFVRQTGWHLVEAEWTATEQQRLQKLVTSKYTQDSWNRKR